MNGLYEFIKDFEDSINVNYSQSEIYSIKKRINKTKTIIRKIHLEYNILPLISLSHKHIRLSYWSRDIDESSTFIQLYIYNDRIESASTNSSLNKNASYKHIDKLLKELCLVNIRSLTCSLDMLIPGLYIWLFGKFYFMLFGGQTCSNDYNYVVPTKSGFGIVLSNSIHWHTPTKEYKKLKNDK